MKSMIVVLAVAVLMFAPGFATADDEDEDKEADWKNRIPHLAYCRDLIAQGLSPFSITSGIFANPPEVRRIAWADMPLADIDQVSAVIRAQLERHPDNVVLQKYMKGHLCQLLGSHFLQCVPQYLQYTGC